MEGERKRAPNFSLNEKTLLLNILYKFKDIIENKKTNSQSWREKDDAWQKVTDRFNSQTPETYPRTKEALRKYYDNIKKNVRKEVADEKQEVFKTGGGVVRCVPNPVKDLALGLMNSKVVTGLANEFDSDALETKIVDDSVKELESANTDAEFEIYTLEHDYCEDPDLAQVIESSSQSSSFASPSLLTDNLNNINPGVTEKHKMEPLESKVSNTYIFQVIAY